ncbi:MAG: hypothetical protein AB1Z98_05425 [Nannocystaceae bacterium]
MELTAHGEYVELSFERVSLHDEGDVQRWAKELTAALGHYARPVDMLLDLRDVHVTSRVGPACARVIDQILRRHAAAVSYFGADQATGEVLGPTLADHDGGPGWPERNSALRCLMQRRGLRLAEGVRPRPVTPHLPVGSVGRRTWKGSGTTAV